MISGFRTKSSHTEVDDEDLKQVEDGGQGLRRLPQEEWSQVWNWKVRHVVFQVTPMGRKVPKTGDPQ